MAILITGAAGFIGSCLVSFLNEKGLTDLILVDDFNIPAKTRNLDGKKFTAKIDRTIFLNDIKRHKIDFVFHIGARTDTTEFDVRIFDELNIHYSQILWNYCTNNDIPFLYASSAATYGNGEYGFDDQMDTSLLLPLNPYGQSKQDFDVWALAQKNKPPFWVGLKFFNVFGPNEYHKGRMASVVLHAFNQIAQNNRLNLFKSHHPDYTDGGQIRDFIYVKDLVAVIHWMMHQMLSHEWVASKNGLYNLGTGKARTFYDLAANTFIAQGLKPNIEFIDMPEDIRDKYQYFTEANMSKLRAAGYAEPFSTLEEGVADYVKNYLLPSKSY